MRVLFTGGSGLLSLNWALVIRENCEVILGLHKRKVWLSGTKTLNINLESFDRLYLQLQALAPDLIINTAAITNIEYCESNHSDAYNINVINTENIAKASAILNIKLVHISTDQLFSGKNQFAKEETDYEAVNIYGKTKAEAERKVLLHNPDALVIRTNFYGWGTRYRKSFSDFIINSLREKISINLFKDVFYTPIFIETLANIVHELVKMNTRGVYNVVGHERISKYEFGLIISSKFNLDSNLIEPYHLALSENFVRRPMDMSLSNKKVTAICLRDIISIDDQINRLIEHENNGNKEELYLCDIY